MHIWLKRIVVLALLLTSFHSAAAAQIREGGRGLEDTLSPGETAWITDSSGREEKTRIIDVSGDALTIAAGDESRRLASADISRVRVRHSDSVLNGALIGAGAAIASGLFLCNLTEPWANCRDDVGPMIRIGAIGAGIGIGIDALIRGRKTVYEAPRGTTQLQAAPIFDRHRRGMQVSFSF